MSSIRSEPIATSDTESVDEALLSPSDGLFHSHGVPDEMHIPDPRQSDAQAADKEREARLEQEHQQWHASTANASTHALQQGPSARRLGSNLTHDHADERTPLISSAPPAYSDIVQDTNTDVEARAMGNETALFPSGNPQHLGGEQEPLLDHPPRRQRSSWKAYLTEGNKLGKLLAITCCGLLLLACLGKLITYVSRHRAMQDVPSRAHARPLPASCRGTIHRRNDEHEIASPESFTLVQRKLKTQGRHNIHITGQVFVEKSEHGSGIHVDVEYRTNVESLLDELELKPSAQNAPAENTLELWTPQYTDERPTPWDRPCIDVDVVLSVPSDASLDLFHLSTETLNIVFDEVAYTGSNTSLKVHTGSVYFAEAAQVHTRVIRVHVSTGSVKGTYPLLDLLDIETGTGSIDVTTTPQPADKHEFPAKLSVDSNTGSVRLQADLADLPTRDYQTNIASGTGSLNIGPLMHGSRTVLRANTAFLDATLTPVGPLGERSVLEATSNTGTVSVAVAPHIAHSDKAMRNLNGKYVSHTGRVHLTHPLQWEGTVRADTGTGSVKVDWPGLNGGSGDGDSWFPWPGSRFEGRKGRGDAVVEAHSGTGSVELIGRNV